MKYLLLTLALGCVGGTVGGQWSDTLATIDPETGFVVEDFPAPCLKPNTKYQVIWHEFVPLIANCRMETKTSYGYVPNSDALIADTISIYEVYVCDTVGFRPTVIEYKEIEE